LQKAMEDFDMAVENASIQTGWAAFELRAQCNEQLGRWDAAIRDWTQAVKLAPKWASTRSLLFRVLIDCPDPALRYPGPALPLDKEYGPLYDNAPDERRRLLDKAKELIDAEKER